MSRTATAAAPPSLLIDYLEAARMLGVKPGTWREGWKRRRTPRFFRPTIWLGTRSDGIRNTPTVAPYKGQRRPRPTRVPSEAATPMFHDDDPSPRQMVPSGRLERLADGSQRLPDLRGKRDMERPAPPKGLKTARQKRQFALDVAMLRMRQDGYSITDIGRHYEMPRETVRDSLARCRKLAAVQSGYAG